MFARIMIVVGVLAALGLAGAGLHGYLGFVGRAGLETHILVGLGALLVFVTAHCWVFFYLVGLARVLAETAADIERPPLVGPGLTRFGRRTALPIVLAVVTALAVFVVGAAMHGERTVGRYHGSLLWPALALAAWATVAEWRAVIASERALAALREAPAAEGA